MWKYLARLILRRRYWNLIFIGLSTIFMGYWATRVKLSYEMTPILPASDSTSIEYNNFKKTFGQDGSVLFIGVQDENIFTLDHFNGWYDLTRQVRDIEGVEEVVSVTRLFHLRKNEESKKFDFLPVFDKKPETQHDLDSLMNVVFSLPFYDGLLLNRETNVTMMMVTLDKEVLNSKQRVRLINDIRDAGDIFSKNHQVELHYSGLPYIRTVTAKKVEDELKFFIVMALVVASVLLMLFFKNFRIVLATMVIVIINVIWVFGLTALLGYKITMLTGILPPLLIVIVVENCIFLLNKYHTEINKHGNKIRALTRVVIYIGNANLLTNAVTASGFIAFTITGNQLLYEFGIVASISILVANFMTLFLIPIFFSFLKPPHRGHTQHLEKGVVSTLVNHIVHIVQTHRTMIYSVAIILVFIGIYGISKLKTTGNIVDDIPKKDPLYIDLMFFEEHFKGVMPFEISIDTKKKRGVLQLTTIEKIEELQQLLAEYPELSKPLSVTEVVKFAKQAFYGGNPKMYSIPNNQEKNFILKYVPQLESGKQNILHSFVDSNLQVTRISVQMANIGTKDIQRIKDDLTPKIDAIFPPDKYDVVLTGTSVVFLKGTNYLIGNLIESLILAVILIAGLMAILFTSARMIVISIAPNVLPQILTAAMMGFLAISVKPSTVLIFSIALGISVDNAIQFLSRYRLQLRLSNWNIRQSVLQALRETGFSMIYSSVVLVFGFGMFIMSSFGGTEALGYLIAFTLLVALLCNLFILPSLLLTMDHWITTKKFKEPLLEIFDEEIDIELNDLEIENIDTRGSA